MPLFYCLKRQSVLTLYVSLFSYVLMWAKTTSKRRRVWATPSAQLQAVQLDCVLLARRSLWFYKNHVVIRCERKTIMSTKWSGRPRNTRTGTKQNSNAGADFYRSHELRSCDWFTWLQEELKYGAVSHSHFTDEWRTVRRGGLEPKN